MTATMIPPATKCGEMPSIIALHIGLFLLRVESVAGLQMLPLRQHQHRAGLEPPAVEMRRRAAIGRDPMAVGACAAMAHDSDQIARRVEARDHAGDSIALTH